MKKKKYFSKLVVLGALLLSFSSLFAQQDPMYSQYMFNPLSINPAYAGSRGVMNGALVYRQQWVSFPGAPNTQALAINTPLKKNKIGIGLELIRDEIGPKSTIAGYLSYAYRIPVGKGKLAFGLAAGIMSYTMDWSMIEYKDPGEPYAFVPRDKKTLGDFKFGMYFNNKKFYAGLAITHLNNAEYIHFVRDTLLYTASLSQHLFITSGYAMNIGENFTFNPSIMLRSVVNVKTFTADLNLNMRYKEVIWFGISLRSEKSLIVMAQYNINDKLKVGYSYDAAFGKLAGYHGGTHEIMLGFDLNVFHSDVMSPRYF